LSCRDKNDQPFLDLAESGKADLSVTGDRDLLALAGQTRFFIETPARHRPVIDKGQEYADNSKQSLYAGIRNAY